ncbi:hypothetical protein [Hydrogenophaga sp.]|uniref:hypothetical protein n=1 Tax=Hydrogenophaga sp. TaxID=1904254 RepID=UPI0027244733|nr:hypothetical protein [Hydrogenophaga sp.]MDO8905953.1 hypothetical protein [Hydrogenophaga sp.]
MKSTASNNSTAPATLCADALENTETRESRVRRLYAAPGGPLMGWLFDEAMTRGHSHQELARHLKVTTGYLYQLRNTMRQVSHISQEFARSCACYLSVPTVVVMLISGQIRMSDFAWPVVPDEVQVERAFQRLANDPVVRVLLPEHLETLNFEARRALVLLYSEVSGHDFLALHQLPQTVQWLQRAAVLHDESEAEAIRDHRDGDI